MDIQTFTSRYGLGLNACGSDSEDDKSLHEILPKKTRNAGGRRAKNADKGLPYSTYETEMKKGLKLKSISKDDTYTESEWDALTGQKQRDEIRDLWNRNGNAEGKQRIAGERRKQADGLRREKSRTAKNADAIINPSNVSVKNAETPMQRGIAEVGDQFIFLGKRLKKFSAQKNKLDLMHTINSIIAWADKIKGMQRVIEDAFVPASGMRSMQKAKNARRVTNARKMLSEKEFKDMLNTVITKTAEGKRLRKQCITLALEYDELQESVQYISDMNMRNMLYDELNHRLAGWLNTIISGMASR